MSATTLHQRKAQIPAIWIFLIILLLLLLVSGGGGSFGGGGSAIPPCPEGKSMPPWQRVLDALNAGELISYNYSHGRIWGKALGDMAHFAYKTSDGTLLIKSISLDKLNSRGGLASELMGRGKTPRNPRTRFGSWLMSGDKASSQQIQNTLGCTP